MSRSPATQRLAHIVGHPWPATLSRRSKSSMTRLAKRLASVTQTGDIYALVGSLGSGKTWLVDRICRTLASDPDIYVTSPTYTIANIYPTKPPIAHLDLYRLMSADDFYALGGEEYFGSPQITFVEWADRMPEIFPPETVWIGLEQNPGRPDDRCIHFCTSWDQLQLRMHTSATNR